MYTYSFGVHVGDFICDEIYECMYYVCTVCVEYPTPTLFD